MTPRFTIAIALLVSACANDVRDLPLAEVDLSDMGAVRELGWQLGPADRAALITYAAVHAPSSAGFCGRRLVGRSGKEPTTVGEAIDLTRDLQADILAARVEAEQSRTPAQLVAQQWDDLIIRRELLVGRQSVLLSEHGSAARRLPEWRSLETEMIEYDNKLAALKAKVNTGETS